jgi:hypothetical protein
MQGYPTHPTGTNNYFSQQQSRRPVPRFDMNLKDLFSSSETDKRSFSRVSNQVSAMRPPPPPIKHEPQSQSIQPFTADLKISPQLRPHHHQPSQTQNQNQTPFFPSPNFSNNPTLSPPLSTSPPMPSPYQISNQLPYNAFAQNINTTYPDIGGFSDLDFLDSFPVQGGGSQPEGMQDVGIGFGMGFGDGTHDWSDGNGFDLFDGFFFGPGGTGG